MGTEIKKVAVVGAGDMGHGIAELFAVSGYEVKLTDKFPEMLDRAKVRIAASLGKLVERGKLSKEDSAAAAGRIEYLPDAAKAVSGADLVIEAVPESLELKQSVLRDVSMSAPREAILASNTSNIRISDLATAASGPERVVGMHFFNPPMIMKLVEVIPGAGTDPAVADRIADVCGKLGRTAVKVAKDSPGFIVNRINAADTLFFCLVLDRGVAAPAEVDNFAKAQGLPMGPYELLDFVGVDIGADSLAYFSKALSPEYGKGTAFAQMVKEGKLGKKTGKGFYDWSTGRALIPKTPPTDKITIMDIFALEINESVKLIEEGVATPEDIEKGVVLGMNRPFGPISVAKDLSNAEVKSKLEELVKAFDCEIFAPAKTIVAGKMRDAVEGRVSPAPQASPGQAAAKPVVPTAGTTGGAGSIRLEKLPGGVARVVLNRPRLNLINGEVLDGLDAIITELWDDPEVRVVVVTGEGGVFSAGFELTQYVPSSVAMMEFARKGERVMKRLTELPKLTVAVLKGYALGGGLELALSCDLRLATEDVELRFPELTRGLVPAWSGTQRLPRLVGLSRANSMILASESIGGRRGYEIGLVNQVLGAEDPDGQAAKYASELASSQAPVAVALAKTLLNRGGEVPSDIGLEMEALAAGVLFGTEDLKEGLSAFLGKRKPDFKGK
jgi:enoyl-CoA hydratase/3-hydroxyacyl-CoA dehydrogenase